MVDDREYSNRGKKKILCFILRIEGTSWYLLLTKWSTILSCTPFDIINFIVYPLCGIWIARFAYSKPCILKGHMCHITWLIILTIVLHACMKLLQVYIYERTRSNTFPMNSFDEKMIGFCSVECCQWDCLVKGIDICKKGCMTLMYS